MMKTLRPTRLSRLSLRFGSCAALLAFAGGCERKPEPLTAISRPSRDDAHRDVSLAAATGSKFRLSGEDFMVALTREEPGLVGYFLDQNGAITAYVKDTTRFSSAREVLSRHLTTDGLHLPRPFRGAPIRLLKADYS